MQQKLIVKQQFSFGRLHIAGSAAEFLKGVLTDICCSNYFPMVLRKMVEL
jgi:hypothetical protein